MIICFLLPSSPPLYLDSQTLFLDTAHFSRYSDSLYLVLQPGFLNRLEINVNGEQTVNSKIALVFSFHMYLLVLTCHSALKKLKKVQFGKLRF